jgi:V/A-type H+/Na+-transporting ATPase subunit A
VTQATLKVVGAFHGLSRERSDARRYPAIDPLLSWSKYKSFIDEREVSYAHKMLRKSHDVMQMMRVIGEEGTSVADYIDYLKGEFFDFVYLQQNAFDEVDEATPADRQKYTFNFICQNVLKREFDLPVKEEALRFFQKLRQLFKGWNSIQWKTPGFEKCEREIGAVLEEKMRKKEEISA